LNNEKTQKLKESVTKENEELQIFCENNLKNFYNKKKEITNEYSKYLHDDDNLGIQEINKSFENELEIMKEKHKREIMELELLYEKKKKNYSKIKERERDIGAYKFSDIKFDFVSKVNKLDFNISKNIYTLIQDVDAVKVDQLPIQYYKPVQKLSERVFKSIDFKRSKIVVIKIYIGVVTIPNIYHNTLVPVIEIINTVDYTFVVMEEMKDNLSNILSKKKKNFSQKEVASIIYRVCLF
jgi:hypothetical protein